VGHHLIVVAVLVARQRVALQVAPLLLGFTIFGCLFLPKKKEHS
jgi:hypothetical protein